MERQIVHSFQSAMCKYAHSCTSLYLILTPILTLPTLALTLTLMTAWWWRAWHGGRKITWSFCIVFCSDSRAAWTGPIRVILCMGSDFVQSWRVCWSHGSRIHHQISPLSARFSTGDSYVPTRLSSIQPGNCCTCMGCSRCTVVHWHECWALAGAYYSLPWWNCYNCTQECASVTQTLLSEGQVVCLLFSY